MNLSQLLLEQGISIEKSLNFVTDGLLILNTKFEILFINHSAKETCGMNPEGHYTLWPQYVGVFESDRKTVFHPDKLPIIRAIRGETVVDERLYIKNDFLEDWKCMSCNASPIRTDDKVVGAIVTFRDITEALIREEIIQKEREAFRKILNSLPAYVFTKDLSGNYTFLNEKFVRDFEKTFGMEPNKDYVTRDMGGHVEPRDVSVIVSKEPQTFEEEYINPNTGESYYFETTRIPLIDTKSEVYGICGISFDVTHERERRKQIEEERTKIATASKLAALGMLAAELGHEINNPLAIIRTSSWIMRKILTSEDYPKAMALTKLDEIDVTVQRISDIVTSVKNLSRDSSKEEIREYVLKDILRDVHSICGPKFQPRGIRFRFEADNPLLKEKVFCYRVQLSEVLINLLVNAIDAVEGIGKPWIRMDILEEKGNIILRVSDNGNGVPEEIEKKIFSPFYSTKDVGKGTGLGLSISKEIMKRHGGDLILNREISGSCFEAYFPKKRPVSAE